MLTDSILNHILERIPRLTVGVLGDLFLDRYLDIDASLTEPSLETGLDAYQVVRVRSLPGAAGTVINNLDALGVKRIRAFAVIGDDGEGHELRQALAQLEAVDTSQVISWPGRRTPTYTKPMLRTADQPARELNRLDIKNRTSMPCEAENRLLQAVADAWPSLDALIVLDQVSQPECGVVTTRVRDRLAELGRDRPDGLILVDSRERIGLFRNVWLKPNQAECVGAVPGLADGPDLVRHAATALARRAGRPVFCTCGAAGILIVDSRSACEWTRLVPAHVVDGPLDIVGAGDSTSAGIACAVAAGTSLEDAAAFGNLVASITIQQLGTTGTASPAQVRQRWCEVSNAAS
jgi:rfaE bifunctional protein kinase chain/domain